MMRGLVYVTEVLICAIVAFGFLTVGIPIINWLGQERDDWQALSRHANEITTLLLESTYTPGTRKFAPLCLPVQYIAGLLGYGSPADQQAALLEMRDLLDRYAWHTAISFTVTIHAVPATSPDSQDIQIRIYPAGQPPAVTKDRAVRHAPLLVLSPAADVSVEGTTMRRGVDYFFYLEVAVYG